MKAKELRIGNFVHRSHLSGVLELIEVETIGEDGINFYCLLDHDSYSIEYMPTFKDLEPIPLTEEWHNKFGVKRNGFTSFEYELPRKNNQKITVVFNGDYVMLRQATSNKRNEDDIVSIWNTDLTKRDMFVHEWQNLYFALTNEELTIKE